MTSRIHQTMIALGMKEAPTDPYSKRGPAISDPRRVYGQIISDEAIEQLYAGQRYDRYSGKEYIDGRMPTKGARQSYCSSSLEGM